MEGLIDSYENLKISAFGKLKQINSAVPNVTVGANSSLKEPVEQKQFTKVEIKNVVKIVKTTPPIQRIETMHSSAVLRKIIVAKEMERIGKVQEATANRLKVMREQQMLLEIETRSKWLAKQKELLQKAKDDQAEILKVQEEHDKDAELRSEQRRLYYQELEERRKRKDEEIKAKEQLKKVLQSIEKVKENQEKIAVVYQDIANILKTSAIDRSTKNSIMEDLELIIAEIDEITHKCKAGVIHNQVQRSSELLEQIQYLMNKIQKIQTVIDDHNKAKEAEIDKFVSKSSFQRYSELGAFLQYHDKLFEELSENSSLKKFKFDCKKAVNIPINAISAANPHHLLDKYNKLSNLLSGKTVTIGDSQICATQHPQGVAFCMDLLAKKFIQQADLLISCNPEAAFCYASVILSLWQEFPDFGKLLLAHFYKQCPYLVPIHLARVIGQSDEEYYTSAGYRYVNGKIENQDQFLKRMAGVMRLYSAIIISKPKKSHQNGTHPHGLSQGWGWLAATLNLEPKTDITATLLHVFLETAGYAMQNVYKNEFRKLLRYIINVYMPMLKKMHSGGPYRRLEVLLEEYEEKGYFEERKGVLSNSYW